MDYPEHINDPVRKQIAEEIMLKELEKLFPDIRSKDLSHYIDQWQKDPKKYHLEKSVRDFWNIFAAIVDSIKLKISLTALITAKNCSWSEEEIEVGSIQLSSQLEQIKRLPLEWTSKTSVKDYLDAIPNEEELKEQITINDSHSKNSQDNYRIIVRRHKDGSIKVIDGNRRSIRAGLQQKRTIKAWVAEYPEDGRLRDYWIPINDLFQIVQIYRSANTDQEKQTARNALEIIFRNSSVARISYDTRIGNQNYKWANELIDLEPTI